MAAGGSPLEGRPLDLDDPSKGTMMENLALEVCLAR
jgi:hypothetical protein